MLKSLKNNLLLYGIFGLLGALFVLYLILYNKFELF
jgi:hypothetical protein